MARKAWILMLLTAGCADLKTDPSSAPDGGTVADAAPQFDVGPPIDAASPVDVRAVIPPDVTGLACAAPRSACGDRCIDLTHDRSNCGACARVCAEHASCTGSQCVADH